MAMMQTILKQLRRSLQMKKIITNTPAYPQHVNNRRKGALLPFCIPFFIDDSGAEFHAD